MWPSEIHAEQLYRGRGSKGKQESLRDTTVQLLESAPDTANIAVLLLTGTFHPVTLAHVQLLEDAHALLKSDRSFHAVIALVSLNPDSHVKAKLQTEYSLNKVKRAGLFRIAIEELQWASVVESSALGAHEAAQRKWRNLNFTRYNLDGADDVLRYEKWRGATDDNRMIVAGRPGSTDRLRQIMGTVPPAVLILPERSDTSSTSVRQALRDGDRVQLRTMLHPEVLRQLLPGVPDEAEDRKPKRLKS